MESLLVSDAVHRIVEYLPAHKVSKLANRTIRGVDFAKCTKKRVTACLISWALTGSYSEGRKLTAGYTDRIRQMIAIAQDIYPSTIAALETRLETVEKHVAELDSIPAGLAKEEYS